MSTLERAIAIAAEAHAGQHDKAGEPYILHPLRVMLSLPPQLLPARIAGVLHDLIEDTNWSLDGLRNEGFSSDIIDAIDALTRRDGEDYFQFVDRAKKNRIAKLVKIADLRDNMDLARLGELRASDHQRMARYERALAMLLSD